MPLVLLTAALVHENGVSSSRLEVNGREIQVHFTFSLDDLASLARLDLDQDGSVSQEEWAKVFPSLLRYVSGHFEIESGGEPCLASWDASSLPAPVKLADGKTPIGVNLTYRSTREVSRLHVRCTLFQEHAGNPRHVAELVGGPVFIFDRDRTDSDGAEIHQRSGVLKAGAWGLLSSGIAALGFLGLRRAGLKRGASP